MKGSIRRSAESVALRLVERTHIIKRMDGSASARIGRGRSTPREWGVSSLSQPPSSPADAMLRCSTGH